MSVAYLKLGSFAVMFNDGCHLFLRPDMRHVLCGLYVCGFLFFCFLFCFVLSGSPPVNGNVLEYLETVPVELPLRLW